MINYFRRIRQKLLSESKISRYIVYAVGETLLVVIGILLALQINNWNQNRIDENKETLYLSGLKEDMMDTQKELQRVLSKTDRVKTITTTLLEITNSEKKTLSNQEIDSLIMSAQGYTIFMTNEGTINELLGSGNLNLIRNNNLRKAIASWEAELKPIRAREELSKEAVKKIIELTNEIGEAYNYRAHNMPLLTDQNRNHILTNPRYRNTFFEIRRNSNILNLMYLKKVDIIDTMLDLVDSELNGYMPRH